MTDPGFPDYNTPKPSSHPSLTPMLPPHPDPNMQAPSETSSTDGKPRLSIYKFPLKGYGVPIHPADAEGAVANWATLYGINIGPRRQPFVIHGHIVEKIPVLKDRFLRSQHVLESETGSITLEDVDTLTFAVAVEFAYTGRLDEESVRLKYTLPESDSEDDDDDDDEEGEGERDSAMPLASDSTLAVIDPMVLQGGIDIDADNKPVFPISNSNLDIHTKPNEDTDADAEPDEDATRPTYDNLLTSTYELAHSLGYESLANASISAYTKHLSNDPPSAWSLGFLQRKGLTETKMMQLMLTAIAWGIRNEGWEVWREAGFMGWLHEGVGNMGLVMKIMAEGGFGERRSGGGGGDGERNGGGGDGEGTGCPFAESEREFCEHWHVHVLTKSCGKRKRDRVDERRGEKGREREREKGAEVKEKVKEKGRERLTEKGKERGKVTMKEREREKQKKGVVRRTKKM